MTNLRRARLAAGLTAKQLAENASTTESRVYSIERGRYKPHPGEAFRMAEAVSRDVMQLFPAGVQDRVQL